MATKFTCSEDGCCKSYSRKDNLLQHMKLKDHNLPATKCGRFKCHMDKCQQYYFHRTDLIKHLYTEHDLRVGELCRNHVQYVSGKTLVNGNCNYVCALYIVKTL